MEVSVKFEDDSLKNIARKLKALNDSTLVTVFTNPMDDPFFESKERTRVRLEQYKKHNF